MARATKKQETNAVAIESISIKRVYEYEDGNVAFDAEINGFTFYGLTLVRYKKGDFISEPSFKIGKGKKEKWLKHYYLNLDELATTMVIEAVEQALAEEE